MTFWTTYFSCSPNHYVLYPTSWQIWSNFRGIFLTVVLFNVVDLWRLWPVPWGATGSRTRQDNTWFGYVVPRSISPQNRSTCFDHHSSPWPWSQSRWHFQKRWFIFKPPPPVGAGGGYMFSGRPSEPLSVRPCVRDSRGSFMFPRYLQYLLTDFRQSNFCHWCILGHRWPDYVFGSKGQSSRSHRRGGGAQHSTLPSSATFSSSY